jgi:predicted ArsR family transcriptional regulator
MSRKPSSKTASVAEPAAGHRAAAARLPRHSAAVKLEDSDQMSDCVRAADTQLLRLFCAAQTLDINQLTQALGVTATAIRQRLERLLAAGLIRRQKVISGRGRPAFEYQLTPQGQRRAGADSSELAEAMWQEISELADEGLRRDILSAVAKRLGRSYAERISNASGGQPSLAEKMRLLSSTLSAERIDIRSGVDKSCATSLPLLRIGSCPYPVLRDATADRSMCQLEADIFSEALGAPVELSHCVLDGDSSCHFVPAART